MPLVSRTFDQLIDFSRTSAATYVDATGKIVTTPASRNLITYTQEFDNAAWTKARCTVLSNGIAAPDGTLTADATAQIAGQTALGVVSQTFTSIAGSTNIAISVYAKANQKGLLAIGTDAVGSVGANFYSFFNLSTGAVGTAASGHTLSIISVGNGWYRCTLVCTTRSGGGNVTILFGGADTNNSLTVTDSGGIYLWGAQLEAASTATDYTRNVAGLFPPRFDYDPVTLAPKGLLIEEQRTNFLLYSEQFNNGLGWSVDNSGAVSPVVTANYGVAPDGAMTADRIVFDKTGGTYSRISQQPGSASAIQTFSVWMKTTSGTGTANVGIRLDTTGINCVVTGAWQRFSVTIPSAAANPVCQIILFDSIAGNDETADVLVWGAQCEAGAFATSYIPTVASQVTRTNDVVTITGANFSQWYNQSEGTFLVEANTFASSWTGIYVVGSSSDYMGAYRNGGTAAATNIVTVASVDQAVMTSGTWTNNTVFKFANAYKANMFAFSSNGASPTVDNSGSVPTVSQMQLGYTYYIGVLNGHIRSIRYYPTRLPNATLQALTA